MQELVGKEVLVYANEIEYRGVLIEIGEAEVHLQAETGYLVIPVGSVVEIKEAG